MKVAVSVQTLRLKAIVLQVLHTTLMQAINSALHKRQGCFYETS